MSLPPNTPIFFYQITTVLSSLLLQLILLLSARGLRVVFKKSTRMDLELPRSFAYTLALTGTCSLLTLSAMIPIFPTIGWVVLSLLILCSIKQKNYFFSLLREIRSFKKISPMLCVVAMITIIDVWAASRPVYRYDQLSYHLIVNKMIASSGKLVGYYFNDHLMTGIYEYFFLLPRLWISDDIWIYCFAGITTWEIFFILIFLVCVDIFTPILERNRVGILAFLIASVGVALCPERLALINCKPDYLLTGFALIILYLWSYSFMRTARDNTSWVFLCGMMMTLPLAYKITWIHALVPLWIISIFLIPKKNLWRFLCGNVAATIFSWPVWIKNDYFYGNILHPQQIGFFRSQFWTADYAADWLAISGRALNLKSYGTELSYLPSVLWENYRWMALILVLMAFPILRSCQKFLQRYLLRATVFFGLLYLVIWPLFYRAQIYPRFVSPIYAVFINGLIFAVLDLTKLKGRLNSTTTIASLLLVPIFLMGGIEVRIRDSIQAFWLTPTEFFRIQTSPLRRFDDYQVMNEDLKAYAPSIGEPYANCVLTDDYYNSYLFNGCFFTFDGNQYKVYLQEFMEKSLTKDICWVDFFRFIGIRYLYAITGNFSSWPLPETLNIYKGRELSPGRLYVLDTDAWKSLRQEDPNCLFSQNAIDSPLSRSRFFLPF